MNKRVDALEQAIDYLAINYPRAKKMDGFGASLGRAFPKGFIPRVDDKGAIVALALVPDEDRSGLEDLLKRAERCPSAFDAVCAWVDGHLLSSGSIPEDPIAFRAAKFVSASRFGMAPSFKRRKRNVNYYVCRYAVLRLAVSQVEAFGFKTNRSQASTHKNSACDIVAEAMVKLRFQPEQAKTIEKIARSGDRVHFLKRKQ